MISYCVSPFAAMCMTTLILLNRIVVFASSSSLAGNRAKLPLISKVILRVLALYILYQGCFGVLVALKLQLHPDSHPVLRYLLAPAEFDYNYESFKEMSFLGIHYLSRSFLDFTDSKTRKESLLVSPNPSVLKPLYMSLCIGQTLETFIALMSGTDPLVENGLTLFEYSLAFQEVQSAEFPSFETIVVALVATVNQMMIHIIGLFNLQNYRLIFSSFVGSYILSFYFFSLIDGRLHYFPFIVVLGYLPQLIIFFIILLCTSIFLLAALFKGSFKELEFSKIIDNVNSVNILLTDDFYTALTNLGSFMITAAGKSSYVKEISQVNMTRGTWLENSSRRKSSIISKITGYAIQTDGPPELQDLRDVNSNGRDSNGVSWIVLKRLSSFKSILQDFRSLVVALVLNRGPPLFLSEDLLELASDQGLTTDPIDDEFDDDYTLDENDESDIDESDDEEEEEIEEVDVSVIQELISSPEDLISLVTTEQTRLASQQEFSPMDLRILRAHLSSHDSHIITRSKFNSNSSEPASKLLDLMMEKRSNLVPDSDDQDHGLPECVICQTNPRQIILWPCKCLSICESCRVSLIVRGFNDCVCCRRKVELYSKVYIP